MPLRDLVRATRREFLSGLSALTVIASPSTGASSDSVSPLAAGPEVDAFKEAQARCSARFGYHAHSRFIKIAKPQLTLHVLEAGHGSPVVLVSGGSTVVQFAAPLAAPLSREFHQQGVSYVRHGSPRLRAVRPTGLPGHTDPGTGCVLHRQPAGYSETP
jgi:hypothetical protein